MTPIHIFDAYGTLFDVHSAVGAHAQRIGPNADALSMLWRTKQLEYSWVYGLMEERNDFWRITKDALDFAMAQFKVDDTALREDLLKSYWTLKAYSEVGAFLENLRNQGCKTGILSNGSPDMLSAAVQSADLPPLLDCVLSVQSAQTFKTHRKTYALVTQHFDASPEDVTFYSSNRWDIAGATKFGFNTIWVNRSNQPDEYSALAPKQILSALK